LATATKRAPAKKAAPAVEVEEDDLLAGLGGDEPAAADELDDEALDLLDGLTEDQGVAWIPADDEDQPRGIQGTVITRDEIATDFKSPDNPSGMVPFLEIQEKGADGQIWSVRGYHTVLRNQINKHDPQKGDFVAIKYLGVKENRKGSSSYENYVMAKAKR